MIPYEDLVSALARWRQRQGLPTGPADYLGEPAPAKYDYGPVASRPESEVVDLSEEMLDGVVEESTSEMDGEMQPGRGGFAYAAQPEADTQDDAIDAYIEESGTGDDGPDLRAKPAKKGSSRGGRKRRR